MTYIGDANDTATILRDANTFFTSMGYFSDNDTDEIQRFTGYFDNLANRAPLPSVFWYIGTFPAALVQVYDLVLPIDPDQAGTYLDRLGTIAGVLLANRDDKRGNPVDPFRGHVMAAFTTDRDGKWNTDVVTSGLLVYAMAAFARRVVDRPDLYPAQLHAQAIALITGVIETYQAFRPELHLVEGDPYAWFNLPLSYRTLTCSNGAHNCSGYRAGAGKPIAYNENLAMMQALAELALAANSNVYRASADATPERLATEETPLVVAKNIAWRVSALRPKSLPDLTPYYEWNYQENGGVEDISHAQFELGCLAIILEDQIRLNALIAAAGRPSRADHRSLTRLGIADAREMSELELVRRMDCLGHLGDQYAEIGGFGPDSPFWGFFPEPIVPGDETRLQEIFQNAAAWISGFVQSRCASFFTGRANRRARTCATTHVRDLWHTGRNSAFCSGGARRAAAETR